MTAILFIKKFRNNFETWLQVGNQYFRIGMEWDEYEEAQWFLNQFKTAFDNLGVKYEINDETY